MSFRRRADADVAQDLQSREGIKGGVISALAGAASIAVGQRFYAPLKRAPLALKAFFVTGFFIFGFTINAERHLLDLEGAKRLEEDSIRREARLDLARQGLISTEANINKWREQNGKLR